MVIDKEAQAWMEGSWVIPRRRPVIDAWRKYYDDMEDLDRRYMHGPPYRKGSKSVQPIASTLSGIKSTRSEEVKAIKNHLDRTISQVGKTLTDKGYIDIAQDIALREHEADMTWCKCYFCRSNR